MRRFLAPKRKHNSDLTESSFVLAEAYPALANFLRSYFPPGEFDMASEAEVIEHEVAPGLGFEEVLRQAELLAQQPELPAQELTNLASHIFRSSDEAREWLKELISLMEEQLKEHE